MLEAQGLSKRYGDKTVVNDLNLRLRSGQTLGLLGPNGAGKSTTVAMLCGLLKPDQGQVLLDGRALQGDADPAKRRIGLVPQELALYELLSARANLQAFGALYGLAGATLAERIRAVLEISGLAERADERVANFSGGMKRRLNIACALLHEPDVLIFDEPTVGVDPQSRNAIFDTLELLRGQGRALLYTTHYMEEAERLCDRIQIVDHGRSVAEGSLDELLAKLPVAAELQLQFAEATPAAPGLPDDATLLALPGVRAVHRQGSNLKLGLQSLDDAAGALDALRGHGLQQFSSGRPSLEAVFLALTGRTLRD
ncbi:ABC transporter ATP-binding protein [Paucibacter sp. APW11]|uniref:ABC transporter ATP-binding protein n=1 Tax=Roseateles aquae TaxID=3077235 RepID=A0ABU3P8E3_9BURK|nr:ABC transporter ATP-binding protein [Paucibacter sp. APW11]MDT8998847.1 ABC transporter ATP-binding protein [Paucibacter sp. APW11]